MSPRVDLAIIGNGSYQALIDRAAGVRWLCWPRFDSSFVFGGLLDEQCGGAFAIEAATRVVSTEQAYLPRTNVLRTAFHCRDGDFEVLDVAPRYDDARGRVAPAALLRIVRPIAGRPTLRVRCVPTADYGREVPAARVVQTGLAWRLGELAVELESDVPAQCLVEGADFRLDQPRYMLLRATGPLALAPAQLLDRTVEHWRRWCDAMQLPELFEDAVMRSALTLALHQYEPSGAVTAAATTSIPEYPGSGRTWDYRFCWLRDAYFTLQALTRLGRRLEASSFRRFFEGVAAASPDRLQPLYGIGGETRIDEHVLAHLAGYNDDGPVRVGNLAYQQSQNDVYGEMIAMLELADDADGALALVRRLLDDIERVFEQRDAGLWEIRDEPKLHTFSLLMHWYGGCAAARLGRAAGDAELDGRGTTVADRARRIIDERCWRSSGYWADAAETDHADAALLMMINLGFVEPDDPRAASHLEHLSRRLAVGDALVARYLHHDGIGATHATFTVCGFWLVEALARLGRYDEAESRMRTLLGYSNHLGLFSEDIDPNSGRQLGNFPQTYSHAGVIMAACALAERRA